MSNTPDFTGGQQAPFNPNVDGQTKSIPPWVYVVGVLMALGLIFLAIQLATKNDSETTEAGMSPELVLQLQNACFNSKTAEFPNGLFYDDEGFCYETDPTPLSVDQRIPLRVAPTAPTADPAEETTDEVAAPAAPAAPSSPSSPSTPSQPAAPSSPSTPSTPAAPTSPETPTTDTTTTEPTTDTTTTQPTTEPTTDTSTSIPDISTAGGWTWRLNPVQVGDTLCSELVEDENGEFKLPSACADANTGPYTVSFAVTNGEVAGATTVAQLGSKTVTFDGIIQPDRFAELLVDMENLGNMQLFGTMSADFCHINGDYAYNTQANIGTFSLDSRRPGC